MNEFDGLAQELYKIDSRVSVTERLVGSPRVACRSPWQSPALRNSWINVGLPWEGAGYALDNDDTVHFKGLVSSGPSDSVIMNLPITLRPESDRYLPTVASGPGAAVIHVKTNGDVQAMNTGTANVTTWVTLHGLHFKRQSNSDFVPMGIGPNQKNYNYAPDFWITPRTRLHLGGMIHAAGIGVLSSASTVLEPIHTVPQGHGSVWEFIQFGLIDGVFSRYDINRDRYYAVVPVGGTGWYDTWGSAWPSLRLESSKVTLSLNGTTSQWAGTNSSFTPHPFLYTDDAGMKFLAFLVNNTSFASGTDLVTLPVGSRPAAACIIPAINNNQAAAISVQTTGIVEINQAIDATWIGCSHPLWIDNG